MPNKKSDRKCSVLFCGEKHHAKGYCHKHYDEFSKPNRDRKEDHKKYNREKRKRPVAQQKPKVPKAPKAPKESRVKDVKQPRTQKRYKEDKLKKAARAAAYRARKYSVEAEVIYNKDVFEDCNWVCGICGLPVDKKLKYPNKLSASLDHIIPLAKGGKHVRANVQLAHLICNMSKGTTITPTLRKQ